jgi:predicted transcriptional regulator
MAQLTIRLDDDLADACKRVAAAEAKSLNGWVVAVLALATDPDHEPSGLERTRERMRRAGVLAEFPRSSGSRPPAPAFREARAAGGRGTPSEVLIRQDRDGGR